VQGRRTHLVALFQAFFVKSVNEAVKVDPVSVVGGVPYGAFQAQLFRAYVVLVEMFFFGGVSGGELEVFDEVLDEGGEEHGGYFSWNGLVEVFVTFFWNHPKESLRAEAPSLFLSGGKVIRENIGYFSSLSLTFLYIFR